SSFAALSEPCQELLVQLAVFGGGWNLESMRAVCEPGTDASTIVLRDLIDRSFVTVAAVPGGPNRFRMLEGIRRYARARREEAGRAGVLEQRFAEHFGGLVEAAAPRFTTRDGPEWLQILDVELDNLRAVLTLDGIDPDLRLRTAVALTPYWHFRGLLTE